MDQKKEDRIHSVIGFLSITGGILFVIGSVVYWPSLTFINPNTGGILFIIGSSFFFACDILGGIVEPTFSPCSPFNNIGSFRAALAMIGNFSFIIGSVFFLPALPAIVGQNIFIIGSAFIWVPQFFSCYGLYVLSHFTAPYYFAFYHYRKYIILVNLILSMACMLFLLGTILFRDENSETIGLYEQGIIMFILGSFLFFVGSIVSLYMRKQRFIDPLRQHHERMMMEMVGMY